VAVKRVVEAKQVEVKQVEMEQVAEVVKRQVVATAPQQVGVMTALLCLWMAEVVAEVGVLALGRVEAGVVMVVVRRGEGGAALVMMVVAQAVLLKEEGWAAALCWLEKEADVLVVVGEGREAGGHLALVVAGHSFEEVDYSFEEVRRHEQAQVVVGGVVWSWVVVTLLKEVA
jgi:hypothetical protein